jgi:hypothetical protein
MYSNSAPPPALADTAFEASGGLIHPPAAEFTAHTAQSLLVAGTELVDQVYDTISHAPRPVFLFHIARAFEESLAALRRGERPVPNTLAQQLCLHLIIDHAAELARTTGAGDRDHGPLCDILLPTGEYLPLLRLGRRLTPTGASFDFPALGGRLSRDAMSTLFAELSTEDHRG